MAALDQRQACAGAIEREIDRSREHGLADLGAALEWNELHIDPGGFGELERTQARGDGAGAHVELSGIALGLGDQLLDCVGSIASHHHERHGLGQQRDRHEILVRIVGQIGRH